MVLISKNGISCNLLNLLSIFLRNRKQKVVLNGQTSSWAVVNAVALSFNPDPSKTAQEVIFTRKTKKEYSPTMDFNNKKR